MPADSALRPQPVPVSFVDPGAAASSGPAPTRPRRVGAVLRGLLLVLVLALGTSACGLAGLRVEVDRVLSEAGLPEARDVTVLVTNGTERLELTFAVEVDADGVARALWDDLPYSFDELKVVSLGEPASSTSSFTAFNLESRYGSRPAALDESSVGGGFGQARLVVGITVLVVMLLSVLLTVFFVVVARRSGRHRRSPFLPGGPGPYGSPGRPGPYG